MQIRWNNYTYFLPSGLGEYRLALTIWHSSALVSRLPSAISHVPGRKQSCNVPLLPTLTEVGDKVCYTTEGLCGTLTPNRVAIGKSRSWGECMGPIQTSALIQKCS